MQNNSKAIRTIFLASFLFFAQYALVVYINSTVLERIVSSTAISTLYVLGAAGSIILLFCLTRIVKRVGLVTVTVFVFLVLAATLLVLGNTVQPLLFISTFMLYSAVTGTVWYCNDLFISHYAKEHVMGHTRGAYLTINNTAVAIMPVIAGLLIAHRGFHIVYIVGALLLLLAVTIIAISQHHFIDKPYTAPDIATGWQLIRQSPSLRRVVVLNFLLQFFYAIMVIYSPLYLLHVLHFRWSTIGIMFSIMLLAFVVLQYPVGKLSDKIGEKALLIAGLVIASISTIIFAVLGQYTTSIVIFTAVLFCTRIGASMIEVLTESYFFKQISDKDEGVISIYRMMYPLAYILGPILGWLVISATSYSTIFTVLGILLAAGAAYAFQLVDIT
jgi:MFS family permease